MHLESVCNIIFESNTQIKFKHYGNTWTSLRIFAEYMDELAAGSAAVVQHEHVCPFSPWLATSLGQFVQSIRGLSSQGPMGWATPPSRLVVFHAPGQAKSPCSIFLRMRRSASCKQSATFMNILLLWSFKTLHMIYIMAQMEVLFFSFKRRRRNRATIHRSACPFSKPVNIPGCHKRQAPSHKSQR